MAHAATESDSLRFGRSEIGRLTVALMLSLLMHLVVWGGYAAGKKYGWWEKLHPHSRLLLAEKKKLPPKLQTQQQTREPEIFVDVSHEEPEPPKNTKYYSNKNSRAANPDADRDSNQPRLTGKQTDMLKTEDVPQLPKLQPSPPPPQPKPNDTPKPPAETAQTPGDLDRITPKNIAAPQQTERPRTLKEARLQKSQADQLPGQKMKQDGGVRRQMAWSSLDAKATAFGDYDRKIIEAVTSHWYNLLDSQRFAQDRTGKVSLYFKLKFDGTISEMRILENTVGNTLCYVCQEAIEEAAPFEKWPSDMRRQIGENYREITFSFYYY